MKVGTKIILGFSIPIVMFLAFGIWLDIMLKVASDNLQYIRDESVVFALMAKDMETNVVQVQQYLSDISATRALNELDDGFKYAETHYAGFNSNLAKFEQQVTSRGDQKGIESCKLIRANFKALYISGVKMAHAYIDSGPSVGNKLMLDFDKASLALQNSLSPFIKAQLDEMDTAVEKAKNDADKILIAGLILGLLVIIISVIVARTAVLSVNRYITQRKQSEDALRLSEQRFRDVSDAAGEYLWEIDAGMVYTYVSNRSADVKGYSPEELLGHTPMEFMPEEDIGPVGEIVNRAIANKAPFLLSARK